LATKPTTDASNRAAAKKAERERDGEKAMAEYLAENRAVQEKTARLRALRLARDAAAPPPAAPVKKAPAPVKPVAAAAKKPVKKAAAPKVKRTANGELRN
jgi:hypothetical protein